MSKADVEPGKDAVGGMREVGLGPEGQGLGFTQERLALKPLNQLAKRFVDICGVLVVVVCWGWLILLIAMLVMLTTGWPVLFAQERVGQGGRVFRCYKFRSMIPDAEPFLQSYLDSNPAAREEWDQFQKLSDDPRVTRFGRFIRRYSLDELPQFWNVLVGDMSIVGPRPTMVGQLHLHGVHASSYVAMKPGITGLWQVSGRNATSYAERARLDTEYLRRWSLWLDFSILWRTVRVMFSGGGV